MTWLKRWEPEDPEFWESEGSSLAWRTLFITSFSLVFSFATWFVPSALVVRMPNVGFRFSTMQLFWLAAMPGLAGGTLRLIHSFLIPIFGTRLTITVATFAKIIPMVWLFYAIQNVPTEDNPGTSFGTFLIIYFLCGFGGGDFSSYMPSSSLFFPKRLQGTAMGIQAGVSNFGVGLTQFVTPWIVTFPAFGVIGGVPQIFKKGVIVKDIWLQNAAFWYVPVLVFVGIICAIFLRSVPVKASLAQQFDIMPNKHTWFCTITYIMTFGSFSGYSAAFPMMIKTIYGGFPNAPDPLKFAFLGPLIGSILRFLGGPLSDKWGGSIWTQFSGFGLIGGCLAMILGGYLTPTGLEQFPGFIAIMLWIFLMSGIGNFATFRQYPIIFAYSPRQGAQILGWTGAWAAYGPFIFSALIGVSITRTGSAITFFAWAAVFYAIASLINWWYYTRIKGERYDFGTWRGTWWDKAKDTWPSSGGARYAK